MYFSFILLSGDIIRAKQVTSRPRKLRRPSEDLGLVRLIESESPWLASVVCDPSSKLLKEIFLHG